MSDPTTFAYRLLRAVESRIELTQDAILHGTPKDMESYRHLVGELNGLEFTQREIRDLLQSSEDE